MATFQLEQLCGKDFDKRNHLKRHIKMNQAISHRDLKGHDGGPALGQAGGLSRLDRWRSWVNEIKRFLVITLSD